MYHAPTSVSESCYNVVSFLQISRDTLAGPWQWDINGLMQERRNSIANALELRLSGTNPSIWGVCCKFKVWFMFCCHHICWLHGYHVKFECIIIGLHLNETFASMCLVGSQESLRVIYEFVLMELMIKYTFGYWHSFTYESMLLFSDDIWFMELSYIRQTAMDH